MSKETNNTINVKIQPFRLDDVKTLIGTGIEVNINKNEVFLAYDIPEAGEAEVLIGGQTFSIQRHWLLKIDTDNKVSALADNLSLESAGITYIE